MKTSDAGLRFIAGWEGLRNQLYNDDWRPLATSKGNCTIGVGHLVHTGPCTYANPSEFPFFGGITDAEAIELMRRDVPRYEAVVNRNVKVPINQNQYDACVDFSFNTGGGYPELWRAINTGGDVCAVLMRTAIKPDWATKALKKRREVECKLYNAPVTVQEEDEMWVRHVEAAKSSFWNPAPILDKGFAGTIQLVVDLPRLPADAVWVDFEIFTEGAGELWVWDGDGQYAGRLTPQKRQAVIRARPLGRAIKLTVVGASVAVPLFGVVGLTRG